jgi:hypothetical protein
MLKYAVGEMAGQAGERVRLAAAVAGEMKPQDIPLAPGVNLDALKAGDPDPLEVVVSIPAGKSKRGWDYTPQALQKIVSEIMTKTASGFLGHQRPEDVDNQFPAPVTHWVGALWQGGKAYVRGVVDAAAQDLKRWVRSGRVKQVSIFGIPTLEQVGGETRVVDYRLLSIDWTPLDRAGMPTAVVATGEIDAVIEPPAGAGTPASSKEGGTPMNLKELITKLKELGITARQLAAEMGWKTEDVLAEIGGEMLTTLKAQAAQVPVIGEIAAALGLAKDAKPADVVAAAKAAHDAEAKVALVAREQLVDKVIGEMVVTASARPLVKRMFQSPVGGDEAALRKALGEMLEAADVKAALGAAFKEPVIAPVTTNRETQTGLRVRRVSI